MTIRAALTAGTIVSLTVTAAWSYTATLTIGQSPLLHLTRDLPGDYVQLATAATGSTWAALFAVTAVVYAACLVVSGLRGMRAGTDA